VQLASGFWFPGKTCVFGGEVETWGSELPQNFLFRPRAGARTCFLSVFRRGTVEDNPVSGHRVATLF
jgi:hypothetical protein